MLYGNIHVYSKDNAFTSPFPMLKETCLIGHSMNCDIHINTRDVASEHIRLSYSPIDNSIYIENLSPSPSISSSASSLPITVTNIDELGRSVVLDAGAKHKLHHGDMWELQGRRFRFDYNSLAAGGDVPSIPVLPDTPKRSVTDVFGLPREVNERAPLVNSPFRMVTADSSSSTASYSTNIAEKSSFDKLHVPSTAKDELREFRAEAQKSQVGEPFSLAQKTELPSSGSFIKEPQQPSSIFSAATEIDPFSAKISSASETLDVPSKPKQTVDLFQTTLKQPSLQMQPAQTQPSLAGSVQAKPSIRDGEVFVDAIEGTASAPAAAKKQHAASSILTLPKDTTAPAGSKSPRRRESATIASEPVKSSDKGTPTKPEVKKGTELPSLGTAIVTLPSSSIAEMTPQKKPKASPSPSTPKSIPLPSMKTEMKQEEKTVIQDISNGEKVTEPVKVSTPKKSEIKSDDIKKDVDAEVEVRAKESTPKKEPIKEVTPKKEITKESTPKKEPIKEVTPKKEITKEFTPKKEPTEEIAVKENALKELSTIKKENAIEDTPKPVAAKKETEKTPVKESATPKSDSPAVKTSAKKTVEQPAMEVDQVQPIKDLDKLSNTEKPTVLVAAETESDIETPTKKAGRGRKPASAKKKEPEIKKPEAVVEPESNAEVKSQKEESKADVELSNVENEEDKDEAPMESAEQTPKKSLKRTPAKTSATPKSTRKTPTGKNSATDETETPTPSKSTRKRRSAAAEDGEETETPSKRTLRSRK